MMDSEFFSRILFDLKQNKWKKAKKEQPYNYYTIFECEMKIKYVRLTRLGLKGLSLTLGFFF